MGKCLTKFFFFFFQAEDGIRDADVTGVQTCALPIWDIPAPSALAAEADLFRHLIGRDVLTRLAQEYPTPRKKEEVPVWLYLASQISLKLHDASYHAFPYVLRSGGV